MNYLKQFEEFKLQSKGIFQGQIGKERVVYLKGAGVDTPVYIRYILQKLTSTKLLIVSQYLRTTNNTLSLQTKESSIDSLVSKTHAVVTQENSVKH